MRRAIKLLCWSLAMKMMDVGSSPTQTFVLWLWFFRCAFCLNVYARTFLLSCSDRWYIFFQWLFWGCHLVSPWIFPSSMGVALCVYISWITRAASLFSEGVYFREGVLGHSRVVPRVLRLIKLGVYSLLSCLTIASYCASRFVSQTCGRSVVVSCLPGWFAHSPLYIV
jgi:hypothetical protein